MSLFILINKFIVSCMFDFYPNCLKCGLEFDLGHEETLGDVWMQENAGKKTIFLVLVDVVLEYNQLIL